MLKDSEKRILQLEAQENAVASMAGATSGPDKAILLEAVRTIQGARYAASKKLEVSQAPVQVLDPNATEAELASARVYRAVRRGDETYLPSWQDDVVGMPNALIRSSLFASSSGRMQLTGSTADSDSALDADVTVRKTAARDIKIFTPKKSTITLHGFPMQSYDRQVYAACLHQYRRDRPLNTWCQQTYYQLARDMGRKQGIDVYRAIRASLCRLSIAVVSARLNDGALSIAPRRLLEVDGIDGARDSLSGSDLVEFRVPTDMAEFYGPHMWSKVTRAVFRYRSGLRPWIAAFYSTHGGPWPLSIESLHKMSGMECKRLEFQRRLMSALSELESDDTPENLRVVNSITDGEQMVVYLERWCDDPVTVRKAIKARQATENSATLDVENTVRRPLGASIFAALRPKRAPE